MDHASLREWKEKTGIKAREETRVEHFPSDSFPHKAWAM